MSKKVIRPFARQGNFTVFDNCILDVIMPKLPPNAWKCLCFIIRKTIGWQKEQDAISFSQIREGTGISSDQTVSRALKVLQGESIILVLRSDEQWETNQYRLNTTLEIVVDDKPTTENVAVSTTENVAVSTTETVDTKETKKENKSSARKPNYLADLVVSQKNGVSESTATNPADQWFEYRDVTVELYINTFDGIRLNQHQKGELAALAGADDFDPGVYEKYLGQFAIHGGYKYDVGRFVNGYHVYARSGDIYKAMGKGGMSQVPKGGSADVVQTEDGGYYV